VKQLPEPDQGFIKIKNERINSFAKRVSIIISRKKFRSKIEAAGCILFI
jgi:hypothetical protein